MIIGGVLGGVGVVALGGFGVYYYKKGAKLRAMRKKGYTKQDGDFDKIKKKKMGDEEEDDEENNSEYDEEEEDDSDDEQERQR